MGNDKIEETLAAVRESTKGWDDAMHHGRMLVEAASRETESSRRTPRLREAARQFQDAARIDPARDESLGWLARALRLLAQSVRELDAVQATRFLRCACAAAWEGKSRTSPAALSVFTKQEAKSLVAWVRATRRLDPHAGEREMELLRAEFLTSALDPDTIGGVPGT
jgi:hypothetical protein